MAGPTARWRRALPADAAAVRDLTRAAYAKWVPVIGREPKPMTADFDDAVRRHIIELLYIDASLVGLLEVIPHTDHLLIENVAVAPACQGRGYGRRLLARADHITATLGLPETRLYTNRLFAENVAFYRDLGFGVDREEPFGGGFVVHMSKPLAGRRATTPCIRTPPAG